MLDRKSYLILEAIVNSSKDGESVVLEKEELLSAVDHVVNEEELGYCIEELSLNEMISVKYSDDNLYVVTPLAKGRVAAEKQIRITQLAELTVKPVEEQKFDYKRIGAIAGLWAFLGGMFAAAIAFIIARFS
ncbi:MAG: hypothetical protein PHC84_03775 [Clostridia bacterium]|nr:hypothetical protein [Clostridia bacterium]